MYFYEAKYALMHITSMHLKCYLWQLVTINVHFSNHH